MTTLEEKKKFINWLIESVKFYNRESYWILNYLINHDVILNRVVFVEQADKTKRGLTIKDQSLGVGPHLFLTKEGMQFTDTEQIFHDIRMNWREPLYVDILFENHHHNALYQSVLEDNPFLKKEEKEQIDETIYNELNDFFIQKEENYLIESLRQAIDVAVDEGDEEQFLSLSKELKERMK